LYLWVIIGTTTRCIVQLYRWVIIGTTTTCIVQLCGMYSPDVPMGDYWYYNYMYSPVVWNV